MFEYTTDHDQYTPAELARFTELRRELLRDGHYIKTNHIAAAASIAPLLKQARTYLATFRPRVCSACGHVFSPAGRSDPRCLDCAPRPIAHGMQPLPQGGE